MRSYFQFQKNQAQARARKRTEYLNDIKQDSSGNWSYEGEWMACVLPVKERVRVTVSLWLLLVLAAVCCIVCGCIRGTGMEGCFYVLIPYASAVFAICFCIRHLYSVSAGRGWLWKHYYAKHMKGLGPCLIWGFLSCLLCVIGRIGEAFFSGGWITAATPGSARGSVLFLILQLVSVVILLCSYHLQKRLVWKTAPKR